MIPTDHTRKPLLPARPANNSANPFSFQSPLNLPLGLELAQEIHFRAMHRAVFQPDTSITPTDILSEQFRNQVVQQGSERCLVHPAYVAEIFTGVTTAVYQTIEQLYCDPLERSTTMVYNLLARMAHQVGQPPIHPEAVWAICSYLYQKHQTKIAVTTRPTQQIWHLLCLTPDIRLRDHTGHIFEPLIVCVLNFSSRQVLAFWIVSKEDAPDPAQRMALYYAMLAERSPSVLAPRGLVWQLPRAVVPDTDLMPETHQLIEQMGILVLRPHQFNTETTAILYESWDEDLRRYPPLWFDHFISVFDNFLEKSLGYSPLRVVNSLKRGYNHLIGFQTDPGSQFPALRKLLPTLPSCINPNGEIYLNKQRFEHPFLSYWPDTPVDVRHSTENKNIVWVYIDGHFLCEAISANH